MVWKWVQGRGTYSFNITKMQITNQMLNIKGNINCCGLNIRSASHLRVLASMKLAENFSFFIVSSLVVVLFKRLGISNNLIMLYSSIIYVPWLFLPVVFALFRQSKNGTNWIFISQLFIAFLFLLLSYFLSSAFLRVKLVILFLVGAGGVCGCVSTYRYALINSVSEVKKNYLREKAMFGKMSLLVLQGVFVMFAGVLEVYTRQPIKAWMFVCFLIALLFFSFAWYNYRIVSRFSLKKTLDENDFGGLVEMKKTLFDFFLKSSQDGSFVFVVFFFLPDLFLYRMDSLFFLDKETLGGLGLSTSEVGLIQGVVGVMGLTIGGLFGKFVTDKNNMVKSLFVSAFALTLPNFLYVYLAYFQPESLPLIGGFVFIDQMGNGYALGVYIMVLSRYVRLQESAYTLIFFMTLMIATLVFSGFISTVLQQIGFLNYFIVVASLFPLSFVSLLQMRKNE